MVSSTDTFQPVLIICPGYFQSYKVKEMNKYGIKDRKDYWNSNLQGNDSTLDEKDLFDIITNNLTEVVHDIEILFKSGKLVSGLQALKVQEKRL